MSGGDLRSVQTDSRLPADPSAARGATPSGMAIGQCDFCGDDIVAPGQVLVWAADLSYHQPCYQSYLARLRTDEGIGPAA